MRNSKPLAARPGRGGSGKRPGVRVCDSCLHASLVARPVANAAQAGKRRPPVALLPLASRYRAGAAGTRTPLPAPCQVEQRRRHLLEAEAGTAVPGGRGRLWHSDTWRLRESRPWRSSPASCPSDPKGRGFFPCGCLGAPSSLPKEDAQLPREQVSFLDGRREGPTDRPRSLFSRLARDHLLGKERGGRGRFLLIGRLG